MCKNLIQIAPPLPVQLGVQATDLGSDFARFRHVENLRFHLH